MAKNYAAMITRMDVDIGKLFNLLDSLGIDENTIVFFSSDNGGTPGPAKTFGSNDPFRGFKTDLYEGGIREPFIARWPGKIKAGSKSDHISAFWDFMPTVCDIIGADVPKETDGISFLPALLEKPQKVHEIMYWEYFDYNYNWKPGADKPRNFILSQAVRMGDWKGIRDNLNKNPNAPLELFNLKNDIGEKNNVAGKYPEKVKEILDIMKSERIDTEYFKANLNSN
jgi:arylsulfatase A-like enzyme